MPNPKGNPDSLKAHKLTTNRDEPLTHQVNIKVTKSTYEKLKQVDDKSEFCREAINKALDDLDKSKHSKPE